MKRTAYWVLGFFLIATLASMFLLSWYKGSLVHMVVKHATLQKASPGDQAGLDAAFERARTLADQHNRSEDYLQTLYSISQRLEKVQRLSREGSREILRSLDGFSKEPGKASEGKGK